MKYGSISHLTEAQRITMIGSYAMREGKVVGFVVEDDGAKGDRYIAALKTEFPNIKVTGRGKGPAKGVEWIKVAPDTSRN